MQKEIDSETMTMHCQCILPAVSLWRLSAHIFNVFIAVCEASIVGYSGLKWLMRANKRILHNVHYIKNKRSVITDPFPPCAATCEMQRHDPYFLSSSNQHLTCGGAKK